MMYMKMAIFMIKDGYTLKEISENLNIQITFVQNIKYKNHG